MTPLLLTGETVVLTGVSAVLTGVTAVVVEQRGGGGEGLVLADLADERQSGRLAPAHAQLADTLQRRALQPRQHINTPC